MLSLHERRNAACEGNAPSVVPPPEVLLALIRAHGHFGEWRRKGVHLAIDAYRFQDNRRTWLPIYFNQTEVQINVRACNPIAIGGLGVLFVDMR